MGKREVVVIHGDRDLRELFETVLQEVLGVTTTRATELDTSKLLAHVPPELVLLELGSPEALQLLRQIRSHPEWREVPILGLGYTAEERLAAEKAGADGFVNLGNLDMDQLIRKVSEYLAEGRRAS